MTTEIRAGTISFLMIAYVLALNPQILETTAGTCDPATMCYKEEYDLRGYACLFTSGNPKAVKCMGELRLSLTTATAASSLISCFIIGFFANLPLGLAPGIGINIYFAYQVVGQGTLTYQQALVAVFIEGFIFIALSVSGIRGGIMRYMPANIAFAGSVGMGLLLAYTGLRNLGVIVFDGTTLTTLGGCPPQDRLYIYVASTNFLPGNFTSLNELERSTASILSNITPSDVDEAAATVYACASNQMRSATMWLGIAGGIIMALLTAWRVKGALFIGVAFVTIISWIPGHAASYLGAGASIPGGAIRMETFKQVVAAPTLAGTGLQWDWSAVGNGHFWLVLFTLLYIDILDCTGILLSMAYLLDDYMKMDYYDVYDLEEVKNIKANLAEMNGGVEPNPYPHFVSDKKEFKGQQWAFLSDGLGIIVCSMMGISPVNVYLESAAGIEEGGRTGIVPIVISMFFFVSLFFSPIFSSIPPYATGAALILVGIMLIAHVDHIQWDDVYESIPAFLTIIIMPFTFSIAYGVIAGLVMHGIMHLPRWIGLLLQKARERFSPPREGDDDGADDSSVAKSVLRKRAVARKVFGNTSMRDMSDMDSVQSNPTTGMNLGNDDTKPIPMNRKLHHSKSHHGWYGGRSPSRVAFSGASPEQYMPERYLVDGSSPDDIALERANAFPEPHFPSLNRTMKKSQSMNFAELEDKPQEEDVQLFGNFQLLDLDLGGSESSCDEQIELQHDGSLNVVAARPSISKDEDMKPSDVLNDVPQEGHQQDNEDEPSESSVIDRGISLTDNLHDQEMPILEETTAPMNTNDFKEHSPVKTADASPSGPRQLTRIQSEAALRLKMLFPDQEDDEESPST